MRDVLRRLQQWNERGSKAALCTLVEARGTSPRPVGAWMAVCESGEVVGSITGGCVENDAIERARAEATRIRGEGDAEAARIFAEAFSQDPSFYEFVRSLEVYRKTLGEGTTLVLPPDHPFLEFLLREGAAQR